MALSNLLQQCLVVIIMMLLGFYLQELPGSNVLQTLLPEWPFILTLYFSVSSRYFFGLISAFIVGVLEDVFLVSPLLGIHSLIYVVAAFTLIATRLRFKHLSVFSQSMVVGALVLFKIAVLMVYNSVLYSPPSHFWLLLSVPLSMLIWPLLHVFFAFFASKHD